MVTRDPAAPGADRPATRRARALSVLLLCFIGITALMTAQSALDPRSSRFLLLDSGLLVLLLALYGLSRAAAAPVTATLLAALISLIALGGPLVFPEPLPLLLLSPALAVVSILIVEIFLAWRYLLAVVGGLSALAVWYYTGAPLPGLAADRAAPDQGLWALIVLVPCFYAAVGGVAWIAGGLYRQAAAKAEAQGAELRAGNAELRHALAEGAQAEQALQDVDRLYREIVRNLPDAAALLFDPDLRHRLAAGPALVETNFAPSRWAGRTLAEVALPPAIAAQLEGSYRAALAGTESEFELTGQHHTYGVHITPLRDDAGQIYAGLVLAREITTLRQAAQAVRAGDARYRALAESITDIFYALDEELHVTYANPAAEAFYGLPAAAALGRSLYELFPTARDSDIDRCYQAALRTRQTQSLIRPYERNGQEVWLETTVYPAVGGLTVVSKDITPRRQGAAALARSEERFRAALDGMMDAFYLLQAYRDETGRVVDFTFVDVNARGAEYLGRAPADLVGRRLCAEYPINRDGGFFAKYLHVFETRETLDEDYQSPGSYAAPDWWHHQVVAVADGVVIADRNIDERKRAEAEIRNQAVRAEALLHAAARLNARLDLSSVVQAVCEETAAALRVPAAGIALYDQARDAFVPAADHGLPPGRRDRGALLPRAALAAQSRADGLLLSRGEPAPDPADLPAAGGASAAVFLHRGEELIGLLRIMTGDAARVFSEDELALLKGLGHEAALALANARLFAQVGQQLERLETLRSIDQAIIGSTDLHLVLRTVIDQVAARLEVDAVAVLLLDPHSRALTYAAGKGFRGTAMTRVERRMGEGLAGRAALERRTICIPDLGDRVDDIGLLPALAGEDFVTCYVVPLIAKGQGRGVLEVFHRAPLTPDAAWLDYLDALAGQAAIAINEATLFEGLERTNTELFLAYESTIEGWSRAMDLRDKETEGHTQRVTGLTMRLARALGFGADHLVHVRRGALLHDIGKMGVPDGVLFKQGPLTDDEWMLMRRHPELAYQMLAPIAYLHPALAIPYCHHEHWDGGGYPRGLAGEQIPLEARIFAVVDVYDGLRSDRPYRAGWPEAQVRAYLRDHAGIEFDPAAVAAFLALPPEEDT